MNGTMTFSPLDARRLKLPRRSMSMTVACGTILIVFAAMTSAARARNRKKATKRNSIRPPSASAARLRFRWRRRVGRFGRKCFGCSAGQTLERARATFAFGETITDSGSRLEERRTAGRGLFILELRAVKDSPQRRRGRRGGAEGRLLSAPPLRPLRLCGECPARYAQ